MTVAEDTKYVMPKERLPLLLLFMPLLFALVMAAVTARPERTPASALAPGQTNDGAAAGNRTATEPDNATPFSGEHPPLMIRWSNWRPEFGPALVYARERDVDGMLAMEGPVTKMLMVTSYGEASRLLSRSAELHNAGVSIVGLNTENGLTPANEMRTLNSSDPDVNIVAQVAVLATDNGFAMLWGPIRNVTDSVSDDVIRTMIGAGVSGIALQEQKFIETQPAQARATAVARTRERYLQLAAEMGVDRFAIHVQIMHQRCPDLDNCIAFVRLLEAMPVDSIAIWSNGPIPPEFVRAIRSAGPANNA